jgi:stage II sporulation protein D
MKSQRIVFVISLLLASGVNAQWAGPSYFNTPIRVLLEALPRLAFRTRFQAAVRLEGKLKSARLSPGVLHFTAVQGGKIEMVRIPYRPLETRWVELDFSEKAPTFDYAGRSYRGKATLVCVDGGLKLINTLPVENYLAGSVGSEMNPRWQKEALKAQTIAARTYAFYRILHPRNQYFDINSTTEDQVYAGASKETPKVWQAIEETAGLHLISKGSPASLYYHSRCGGETAEASAVWSGKPASEKPVECLYCRSNPYRWTRRLPASEVAEKLGLHGARNLTLTPTSQAGSGRAYSLEARGENSKRQITAEALRRALGYEKIQSSSFESIRREDANFVFAGVGMGHGVGMCQWGAKYLADKGLKSSEILKHYYPRLQLSASKQLYAGVP